MSGFHLPFSSPKHAPQESGSEEILNDLRTDPVNQNSIFFVAARTSTTGSYTHSTHDAPRSRLSEVTTSSHRAHARGVDRGPPVCSHPIDQLEREHCANRRCNSEKRCEWSLLMRSAQRTEKESGQKERCRQQPRSWSGLSMVSCSDHFLFRRRDISFSVTWTST